VQGRFDIRPDGLNEIQVGCSHVIRPGE
jgi:hypothetical protein